jgi:hypothetical protein
MTRKARMATLSLCVAVALVAGCKSNQPSNQEQPAATSQNSASRPSGLRRRPSESHSATTRRSISSPQAQTSSPQTQTSTPQVQTVTLTAPAGTEIRVRLDGSLSSATAQAGSAFKGTLARALVVQGVEVAPAGSRVQGQVTNAISSGRLSRPAELSLTLTSLTPQGGPAMQISTSTWSRTGPSHKKRDIEMIGGGAGVGALIGALVGHGKGAAIGAAVGSGAGTAGAAYTGKQEIVLQPETELTFRLTAPVRFTTQK